MFERFTDRSRRVVVLAQEEARILDHNYIGPEHILLGLIHEGQGVAARALTGLGVSLDAVRQQTEERIGRGQRAPSGHIPFTPQAKRLLELSLREALQLGHNYIGTEHILLGILREGDNVAAEVLVGMGVDLNRVRRAVVRLLGYREEVVTLLESGEAGEGSPPAGVTRETRIARPAAGSDFLLAEVRNALAGIVERLTAIERHLGMSGGGPAKGDTQEGAPGDTPDEPDEPSGDVTAAGE